MEHTVKKTLLTLKTDKNLKEAAQKTAKEMGIPLGTVLNAFLRSFVSERRVEFSAPLVPNAHTRTIIDAVRKDFREGKNLSPAFSSADDAIDWLHTQ